MTNINQEINCNKSELNELIEGKSDLPFCLQLLKVILDLTENALLKTKHADSNHRMTVKQRQIDDLENSMTSLKEENESAVEEIKISVKDLQDKVFKLVLQRNATQIDIYVFNDSD